MGDVGEDHIPNSGLFFDQLIARPNRPGNCYLVSKVISNRYMVIEVDLFSEHGL